MRSAASTVHDVEGNLADTSSEEGEIEESVEMDDLLAMEEESRKPSSDNDDRKQLSMKSQSPTALLENSAGETSSTGDKRHDMLSITVDIQVYPIPSVYYIR